jgi:2-methylisocitrate lyase-like PEP mutase family enzyme
MTLSEITQRHAQTFRSLHQPGNLLVLPNAWDAASARLVEACGASAIATTSAAVSWAHGVTDGGNLSREAMLVTVREIVASVRIPVSVDAEMGYGADLDGVAKTITQLAEAGAVGINLEDGTEPPERLVERIRTAKAAAKRVGVDLFVNARTDVYLKSLVPPERAVDETLRRARLYEAAGCDGLFVPSVIDANQIERITQTVKLPVNVLARPNLPPASELKRLGVRRLSAGAALACAALGAARRACKDFLAGDAKALFAEPMPSKEMNELFAR